MKIDTTSPYGSYTANKVIAKMIGAAHAMPNGFGRQIAQALRKIVPAFKLHPIDVEVEDLNFRFNIADNSSERTFAFMPWRFEKIERDFLESKLKADSHFVDIGANVGIFTLTGAKNIGDQGKVISFEPNPPVFERLQFNINAQEASKICKNIICLNIGLSSKEEEIPLFVNNINLGNSSILNATDQRQESVKIKCRPLNTVLIENNFDRVDFLKIDIEGAEDRVLIPFFEQADSSLYPKNIIIENSQAEWESDLFAFLKEKNYKILFETKRNCVLELISS